MFDRNMSWKFKTVVLFLKCITNLLLLQSIVVFMQMEMLGLKEAVVQMAKANGVRWYGHVLRRDDEHVLRRASEFEVKGKRRQGRPRKTWKTQVERKSKRVGLTKEDALNRARWRVGVGEIAVRVGYIRPPPFTGINPDQNWIDDEDSTLGTF